MLRGRLLIISIGLVHNLPLHFSWVIAERKQAHFKKLCEATTTPLHLQAAI